MNKKGFTLIELLVVIAIIGLLSTLAVVALGSARTKARDSKRLSDLKQIQTALELYYTDKAAYPDGTALILGKDSAVCLGASGFGATCTGAYMGLVPADPSDGYTYKYTMASSTYQIDAALEGKVNDLEGNIRVTPNGVTNRT